MKGKMQTVALRDVRIGASFFWCGSTLCRVQGFLYPEDIVSLADIVVWHETTKTWRPTYLYADTEVQVPVKVGRVQACDQFTQDEHAEELNACSECRDQRGYKRREWVKKRTGKSIAEQIAFEIEVNTPPACI